jgi:hypothetical protein
MQKTAAALALSLLAAASARAQVPGGMMPTAPPPSLVPMPGTPPPGATRAERAQPPPKAPLPRGAVLDEVSGNVREVDRKTHTLTIESVAGPVTLSLDRNTMVYTANGLGTVLDLAPGQQIRAGRNADFLAYWVQLRVAPKTEPSPTPAQGTGPAGGAAAPATESTGKGAGPAPTPPTSGPGAVPPGSAPPGSSGGAPPSTGGGAPPSTGGGSQR